MSSGVVSVLFRLHLSWGTGNDCFVLDESFQTTSDAIAQICIMMVYCILCNVTLAVSCLWAKFAMLDCLQSSRNSKSACCNMVWLLAWRSNVTLNTPFKQTQLNLSKRKDGKFMWGFSFSVVYVSLGKFKIWICLLDLYIFRLPYYDTTNSQRRLNTWESDEFVV